MRKGLSELFRAYNLAKKASKTNKLIESKRLDRALGIVLSRNSEEHLNIYHSDINLCFCPDNHWRNDIICKHRLARMLQARSRVFRRHNSEAGYVATIEYELKPYYRRKI